MTLHDKPTAPVDVSNCKVHRMGQLVVCLGNTTCIYLEEHPKGLKLCRHPLLNLPPEEGHFPDEQ